MNQRDRSPIHSFILQMPATGRAEQGPSHSLGTQSCSFVRQGPSCLSAPLLPVMVCFVRKLELEAEPDLKSRCFGMGCQCLKRLLNHWIKHLPMCHPFSRIRVTGVESVIRILPTESWARTSTLLLLFWREPSGEGDIVNHFKWG